LGEHTKSETNLNIMRQRKGNGTKQTSQKGARSSITEEPSVKIAIMRGGILSAKRMTAAWIEKARESRGPKNRSKEKKGQDVPGEGKIQTVMEIKRKKKKSETSHKET